MESSPLRSFMQGREFHVILDSDQSLSEQALTVTKNRASLLAKPYDCAKSRNCPDSIDTFSNRFDEGKGLRSNLTYEINLPSRRPRPMPALRISWLVAILSGSPSKTSTSDSASRMALVVAKTG